MRSGSRTFDSSVIPNGIQTAEGAGASRHGGRGTGDNRPAPTLLYGSMGRSRGVRSRVRVPHSTRLYSSRIKPDWYWCR